jgi:xanthine dehydrogenase molybdopterin-binding subunit B
VLQASGEALYSGDEPLAPGALYAAYVTSRRAAGRLSRVDWQPALAVQGAVLLSRLAGWAAWRHPGRRTWSLQRHSLPS